MVLVKTLVSTITTIGVAFLLTPDYVSVMSEFVVELFSQWFWFF